MRISNLLLAPLRLAPPGIDDRLGALLDSTVTPEISSGDLNAGADRVLQGVLDALLAAEQGSQASRSAKRPPVQLAGSPAQAARPSRRLESRSSDVDASPVTRQKLKMKPPLPSFASDGAHTAPRAKVNSTRAAAAVRPAGPSQEGAFVATPTRVAKPSSPPAEASASRSNAQKEDSGVDTFMDRAAAASSVAAEKIYASGAHVTRRPGSSIVRRLW